MIRLLKRFADWLDRRFPPKVVVDRSDYERIQASLYSLDKRFKSIDDSASGMFSSHNGRIFALEKSVAALKDLLAKGGVSQVKPEAEKLREQFVKGEFNRGPSRAEVESAAK